MSSPRFISHLDFLSQKGSVQILFYFHIDSQKFFENSVVRIHKFSLVSFMCYSIFSHSVECLFTLKVSLVEQTFLIVIY